MGLGQYAGAASITLLDGSVISNPATTQATSEQCLPYMCGADPANSDARYWCAFWGQSGAKVGCLDPSCVPFRSSIPGCDIVAPTPAAPNPPQVTTPPAILTTANVVQPLPNVTIPNTPVALPVEDDSCWCNLNSWINDNPLIAVLALAGVALLIIPRRR